MSQLGLRPCGAKVRESGPYAIKCGAGVIQQVFRSFDPRMNNPLFVAD